MAFDTSQFREFRYGWPVVLASTFGISLGMSPLPFYTIGVFAQPLAEEFGWGIDQIMFGLGALLRRDRDQRAHGRDTSRTATACAKWLITSMVTFSRSGMMLFALNNGSHTLYLFPVGATLGAERRHPAHHLHQGDLALVLRRKRGLALGRRTGGHRVSAARWPS